MDGDANTMNKKDLKKFKKDMKNTSVYLETCKTSGKEFAEEFVDLRAFMLTKLIDKLVFELSYVMTKFNELAAQSGGVVSGPALDQWIRAFVDSSFTYGIVCYRDWLTENLPEGCSLDIIALENSVHEK